VKKLAAGVAMAALVVVLGAMVLGACSDDGDALPPKPIYPPTVNVTGNLTLGGEQYVRGNISDCAGAAQYADLLNGAPVTVSNTKGVPLAVGKITYSVGTNVFRNRLDECTFRFTVLNVPQDRTGYNLTIAGQPRYSYSFEYLFNARGQVSMVLPPKPPVTTTTLPLVTRPPK
jgi:hypothetical protein